MTRLSHYCKPFNLKNGWCLKQVLLHILFRVITIRDELFVDLKIQGVAEMNTLGYITFLKMYNNTAAKWVKVLILNSNIYLFTQNICSEVRSYSLPTCLSRNSPEGYLIKVHTKPPPTVRHFVVTTFTAKFMRIIANEKHLRVIFIINFSDTMN